ncbi:bifunctional lysylphosphatidylglycerol flippase/synthetase MprF [Quadrisphaera sp. KR29]|uniref:bifunctional lysylphosphatidylglycerol flippase/synthetase MprF n=1 Tax=Quadrisphaera sp. KR29 TaxID=3461391 RepID=UPI004043D9A2
MDPLVRRDRRRRAAALLTRAAGLLALLSASLPPLRGRLETLLGLTPFLLPATAAGVTALAGCTLLVVARGLRRGSRLAWAAALALLAVLTVLHLAKGIDWEEAALTAAVGGYLATQRRAFPVLPSRAAALRAAVLGLGGALAAVVVAAAISVSFGGHRHHGVFGESAEQAAGRLVGVEQARRVGVPAGVVPGLGPASSRVLPVVGVGLACSALWLAFAPRRAPRLSRHDHDRERERARQVVARWGGDTLAFFALRDDKDWFFTGSSVVAHSVRGDVCLVSPDPVGPPGEREAAWADFREHAERNGWTVLVIGASQEWLPVYESTGMRGVYLGDEAVLDCRTFTLEGGGMKSLRQAFSRVGRAGVTFSFHSPADLPPALRAELVALSTQSRRGEAERGFSMTLSRLADPVDPELLLTVAHQAREGGGSRVVGFVQWVPAAGVDGWSLDVMRRSTEEDLPSGIVDAMIIATAQHVRESGQQGLGLNFAVLRTVVSGEQEGRVPELARQVLTRLGGHSQMESLWRFNAKYDPSWRARYVVVDDLAQLATDGLAVARAEGLTGELPLVSAIPRLGEQLQGVGTALLERLPGRSRPGDHDDDDDDVGGDVGDGGASRGGAAPPR